MHNHHITILGDGAFGTACAMLLAHNGHTVTLWCHNAEVADYINSNHENKKFMPGVPLNKKIKATTNLKEAVANDIIFEAIPIMFLRTILTQASDFFRTEQCWVSLTKGIEVTEKNSENHISCATDVIEEITHSKNTVVMSGPSYAHELARHQPTGFVLASKDQHYAEMIAHLIKNDHIKIAISFDTEGVQLVAALKNVCAIGIGILEGAGYGSNAQALFIMQTLEEIKILFSAYGISTTTGMQTLYGLAGIGDLMLTCFGKKSRNYMFGYELGKGKSYEAIIAHMGIAPEGVSTLATIEIFATKYSVNIPLLLAMRSIVFENGDVKNLVDQLCK